MPPIPHERKVNACGIRRTGDYTSLWLIFRRNTKYKSGNGSETETLIPPSQEKSIEMRERNRNRRLTL